MSWKKNFAARVSYTDLPTVGAFKIESEPAPIGNGKFRAILICKDGSKRMLTTFESTIGDIVSVSDGWLEAYTEKVGKDTYIRFRAVK